MSQPLHLRAPATPATALVIAHSVSSLALDDWSRLSPATLPVLAARTGRPSDAARAI